jgi:formylglycine-generating enzyme required for sulfatase activity
MAVPALGQVTNVGATETDQIRVEWAAMPGNPYRVYATPDLVQAAWSNLTPDGVVFADAQGFRVLPTDENRMFYCAMASDFLVVDLSEGPTATNYPVSYTNVSPPGGWGDEYKTMKLVLRRIPAGTFTMGSPTNEMGRSTNEPQHSVTLTKDFYIGVFETTQKQWERVMGVWPSYFTNTAFRDSRPVEYVSYNHIRGRVVGANWPSDGNVDTNSLYGVPAD